MCPQCILTHTLTLTLRAADFPSYFLTVPLSLGLGAHRQSPKLLNQIWTGRSVLSFCSPKKSHHNPSMNQCTEDRAIVSYYCIPRPPPSVVGHAPPAPAFPKPVPPHTICPVTQSWLESCSNALIITAFLVGPSLPLLPPVLLVNQKA